MADAPSTLGRLRVGGLLAGLGALLLATGWIAGSHGAGTELRAWLASPLGASGAASPVGFEEIVERVKPAVFGVTAKVVEEVADGELPGSDPEEFVQPFDGEQFEGGQDEAEGPKRPRLTSSQGSGFFITPDGYAVTTNHVIERGASITITTDDGKTYPVKLIGVDPKTDLALLKVNAPKRFPFVEIADEAPKIGQWVIAVGNPFGLGGTVTAGIVSAGARDIMTGSYNDFIQIDAPVNQGNSGGPTFDVNGKVIGINSAIFSPTGGSVGIGFAIPAKTVKSIVAELKDNGMITRGWIGVEIQSVTPEIADGLNLKPARGALVAEADAGGPAAKSGILSGDVIISLNGKTVNGDREFASAIGELAPGSKVKLGLIRKGDKKVVAATLVRQPDTSEPAAPNAKPPGPEADPASLGLSLAPGESLSPRADGVVVTDVDPGGIAAERGLQAGDIILEVGGSAVKLPADIKKVLSDARKRSRQNVLARVKSSDSTHFVAIPVG